MAALLPDEGIKIIAARQHTLTALLLSDEDSDRVYAIELAAHSHPWSLKLIKSSLRRYHCWGVVIGEELVGFAIVSCVLGEAELLDFVVSPVFQGQGVGSAFMAWLQQWLASTLSAERFFLEVRESNHSAIALYQAAGFAEIGIRHNYYPTDKGREDAILMAMELIA